MWGRDRSRRGSRDGSGHWRGGNIQSSQGGLREFAIDGKFVGKLKPPDRRAGATSHFPVDSSVVIPELLQPRLSGGNDLIRLGQGDHDQKNRGEQEVESHFHEGTIRDRSRFFQYANASKMRSGGFVTTQRLRCDADRVRAGDTI